MGENSTSQSATKPSFFQKVKDIGIVIIVLLFFLYFAVNVLVGIVDVIEFSFIKECQPEETKTTYCYKFADAKIGRLYKGGKRDRLRFIEILRDDKKLETSQMHYRDFWENLKEGDFVKVQIWQDSIRQIQKGHNSAPTAIYPKFDLYNISLDDIFLRLLIFGGFIALICFWIYDRWKSGI